MILMGYQLIFDDQEVGTWQNEIIPKRFRNRGRTGYWSGLASRRTTTLFTSDLIKEFDENPKF